MLVKDLMQKQIFTVEPDDMVDRVFFLIHYEKIRHLPVVEKGKVVGIVSDRDLYKALGPKSRPRSVVTSDDNTTLYVIPRKVRHIMRRGVITIDQDAAAADAARTMVHNKIGCLPVLAAGKLSGLVTSTDVLRAFVKLETVAEAATAG